MQQLQNIIETAFERRAEITPANADTVTREAVNQVIALLDSGALRVAEKLTVSGDASVVEKAVLLFPY